MSALIEQAFNIAIEAHADQVDKGGMPYILHPVHVAQTVMVGASSDSYGIHPDYFFITGLLHDTVEDTPVTLELLAKYFPAPIVFGVQAVTRQIYTSEKKEKYSDFILRAKADKVGRWVKIADILHNKSPERVMRLPESERGVVKRYDKALEILLF